MKRVLVTGATGFIGRQALHFLRTSDFDVHGIYTHIALETEPGITWHKSDLLVADSVERLISAVQPTHLLHLAWYVNPEDYRTSPENVRWKEASLSLLDVFQKYDGKRALIAGSAMEYDPNIIAESLNEYTSSVDPVTEYGRAKHSLHVAAEKFAEISGLSLSWGRIFNLYGPYESRGRYVSNLIDALLRGEKPHIKPGELIYDYSYVLDIAGALSALLESEVRGAVNIASGNPVTLKSHSRYRREDSGTTGLD
jgi:nucleoside-diphosphate-sugar epimerase